MSTLDGDGPCDDCGTTDNIVWFTDNVVWNVMIRENPDRPLEPILCIRCFVAATERQGFWPVGWRLIPEWPWRVEAAEVAP